MSRGRKKEKPILRYSLYCVAIVAIIFAAGFAIQMNPYAGAWEIQASFTKVNHNGVWYTDTIQPEKVTSWGAKQVIYDVDPSLENYPYDSLDMLVQVGFVQMPARDYLDPEYWGSPDIDIQIGSPRHVGLDENGDWETTPDDVPYKTYAKPLADGSFRRFDHHIALLEVEIMTDADFKDYGFPVGWQGEFHSSYGAEATVMVRFDFSISEWVLADQLTIEDALYGTPSDGWAGIMAAYVDSVDAGIISYTDFTDNPHVKPLSAEGAALNMYVGDSFQSPESVADPTGIVGVPQTVTIEIGAVFEAGSQSNEVLGVRTDCAIRNVYALYTVRVDYLASAEYFLVSGDPPTMTTPTEVAPPPPVWDPFGWLGEIFGNPFTFIILVVVIIFVLAITYKIVSHFFSNKSETGRRGK